MLEAPFAPAGSGASISCVLPNHADKHVEQKLALLRRQRIENALVGGRILAAKPVKHPFALCREPQNPGAPVGAVHAPLDKSPFAKLLDQQADMGSFNAETRGEAVLIYSRLTVSLVETGHNSELQRRQVGCSDRVGAQRHAYLVEPPR
ncbi:MAG: hypothetical protein WBF24_16485 [Xanthobacteraceae bacterium]